MLNKLNHTQKEWIENTFKNLTLREKIAQTAQMHTKGIGLEQINEETIEQYLEENPVGSFFAGGEIIQGAKGTAENFRDTLAMFQRKSKIPLLIAGDLEYGAGAAIASLTKFPTMMAIGATNDDTLAYQLGKFTALEGKAAGFNWTFAPVADILFNWLNPVVTTRGLGDEPERVARLSKAIAMGMQDHGLVACAKHFPGDGVDFRDQHIVTSVNDMAKEQWWNTFGMVYRELIDAGVYSIMMGHIALPWLESIDKEKKKYRPATVSRKIIQELLRGQLGFEGVIVSDALEMGGFIGWDQYKNRILEAFDSGCDVMLWPGDRYIDLILEAVEEGKITKERIDESVKRILTLKAHIGLHQLKDGGYDPQALDLQGGTLEPELDRQAKQLSREIAAKSITLVKNEQHLLPLDGGKVKKVLIANLNSITSDRKFNIDYFFQKLEERGCELTIVDYFEPTTCIRELERAGQRWDAFIVPFIIPMHGLLNTVRPTGESAKGIWAIQQLETISPIVISMGSPYLLYDIPQLQTLVNTYSESEGSIDMLVKVLFGEVAFEGDSPVKVCME